jgi:hypothetical protein
MEFSMLCLKHQQYHSRTGWNTKRASAEKKNKINSNNTTFFFSSTYFLAEPTAFSSLHHYT